ncbi:MAG: nitrilase-related carbon-nitrogen hydrolase [Candidatus Kapaibacterium sp.]
MPASSSSTCRVASVQFAPVLFDVDGNCRRMLDLIPSIDADVIVFPELATSGYFLLSGDEARSVAMDLSHESMMAFRRVSDSSGITLVIGFAERNGDEVFNAAVIMRPGLEPTVYRKTHLFYKERHCFSEGDTGFFVTEEPRTGARLGVMICYDWRFPEAARTLALRGADIVVCPSNLVTTLSGKVMPARAIENKVNLVVTNRWGVETRGEESLVFRGESAIYDYHGERLLASPPAADDVIIADLDFLSTRNKMFNSINDIFADRRPDHYQR